MRAAVWRDVAELADSAEAAELENTFRFNDAVIRHLVIRRDKAITEPSHLAKSTEKEEVAS